MLQLQCPQWRYTNLETVTQPDTPTDFSAAELEHIPRRLVPQPAVCTLPHHIDCTMPYPCIVAGKVVCLPHEAAMVDAAFADLNRVLSSDVFERCVLSAAFTETNGLSNQQIYALAVDRSPLTVDFTMFNGTEEHNNVWLTMGYEDPRWPTVCFANRHFITNKELCASLILHETMHLLGFTHRGVKRTSVPYTMNRIYENAAAQLGLQV